MKRFIFQLLILFNLKEYINATPSPLDEININILTKNTKKADNTPISNRGLIKEHKIKTYEKNSPVRNKDDLICPENDESSGGSKSYRGYKVFRTQSLTPDQAKILKDVQERTNLDFWKEAAPGRQADVMIPLNCVDTFGSFLYKHGITFSIMIEDVEQSIQDSKPSPKGLDYKIETFYQMDWDDYHDHDAINKFLENIASDKEWAQVINIGKSYEGRDMKVLALSKPQKHPVRYETSGGIIWIEAGIHAREWIAPAVATYIIKKLVQNHKIPGYLDDLRWFILPVANPDGYMYTRRSKCKCLDPTHCRLWRKSRSLNSTDPCDNCKGVDLNRNWDFHWGEGVPVAASDSVCADTYHGPHAFSEIENRNIRNFLQSLGTKSPILCHTLHNYGQLWMWPYGYGSGFPAYPENWQELNEFAINATEALYRVNGKKFTPENSAMLYLTTGTSMDWYKDERECRFAYTTELRDWGKVGFLLPPREIIPSGEEMWAAFKVLADGILKVCEEQHFVKKC